MPEHIYRGKSDIDTIIAVKSEREENEALNNYDKRLEVIKDPELKKATKIARDDEFEHRGLFRSYISKKRKRR